MIQPVAFGSPSRRRFLRLALGATAVASVGGLLAACSTPTPAAPTSAPGADRGGWRADHGPGGRVEHRK